MLEEFRGVIVDMKQEVVLLLKGCIGDTAETKFRRNLISYYFSKV